MRRCPCLPLLSFVLLIVLLSPLLILNASVPAAAAGPSASALPAGTFVVRVYYETAEDIGRLASFDVFEYNNLASKYVLAAVDRAGFRQLQSLGFRVEVDEEETASFALLSIPLGEQGGAVGIETIPGYTCYRTVEETYQTAQALATNYPSLATWTDVGNSWEKSVGQADGYDMMALKLTNSQIPGDKPKLFITASIHAREYTPAELATRFAEYLVSNYNVDADATWLLDHHEVHLILQTNPDGRKEAEAGRSWRKNTNENYCGVTSTSRGADLNRNFDFRWGCCGGSSGTPCDATYRGPAAGSEPETQAVQNYMRAVFPDQRGPNLTDPAPSDAMGVYLDLHSYSQLVLWPWGFQSALAPNNSALQTLGRKFAYFNSYTPQRSYQLYVTDGTTTDFAYGELGVAAYTFELGTSFFQACTTFQNTIVPANMPALIYAAKVARTPYLTPLGPDALNLALSSTSVEEGTPVTLNATINDTRYRSGTGEPTQTIVAAEYYVDTPPWVEGAVARAMAPVDGIFSSTAEAVAASVDTTGLGEGRHIIFVRGQDAAGNWGAFSAIFLNTTVPTAVELVSFTATGTKKTIILNWETAAETDNLGFNVYRATTENGTRTKLNAALIPSATYPGSPAGGFYTYTDVTAKNNYLYYYWLEDLDIWGATKWHGPVTARRSR